MIAEKDRGGKVSAGALSRWRWLRTGYPAGGLSGLSPAWVGVKARGALVLCRGDERAAGLEVTP